MLQFLQSAGKRASVQDGRVAVPHGVTRRAHGWLQRVPHGQVSRRQDGEHQYHWVKQPN